MQKYYVLNDEDYKNRYTYETGKRTPYEIGIPLVDIPDKQIEQTYYFRMHTYCLL